ncbi:hypothetical protein [Absidia glauca]|uniref:Peptidase A1 domain-containing protein n=1 Tax=Absidia glauca TaxID=4829 RepID=A0A163K740_ABSGL|nr:hypothetical protein [Absidia glauca]
MQLLSILWVVGLFWFGGVRGDEGMLTLSFVGTDNKMASVVSGRKYLQNNIDVPLENIDIAYLIDVSVGSPPQAFTLLLDTGSSASWVSSYGCGRFCGFPARTLQPSKSGSFKSTSMLFTVTYGQGYSHGVFAQDTFNVRGVDVPDVYFGLSFANDGELTDAGAGPDALSKYNNPDGKTLPTLVTSMFDHGIITKNVFSIYFHPVSNDTAIWESPINGDITFGGVNKTTLKSDIVYAPVTKNHDLQASKQGYAHNKSLSIGNHTVKLAKPLTALVDTGSTLIYLPATMIRQIFSKVDGFRRANGLYAVPCNTTQAKPVTFHVNGNALVLNPEDYIIRRGKLASSANNMCSTYFMDSPPNFGAILGYGFLQQFVTVFDNESRQIGFGQRV